MKVLLSDIKANTSNPRIIKDDKFKKLVRSLKEFPEMLDKRPIVVDENMVILGGNMRYLASKEIGLKEVEVIVADNWTEKQKKEFIIKDNVNYGVWDWDILANEWHNEKLNEWGLDVLSFTDEFGEETLTENNIPDELDQVTINFSMPNYTYVKVEDEIQNIIKKYPNIKCKIQN